MFLDIKLVIMDIDGVLTDGVYQISEKGKTVTKSFYTRDFYGIEQLMKNNIDVTIISQSHDDVIHNQIKRICDHSEFWSRCLRDFRLEVRCGIENKKRQIEELFVEGFNWDNIAYIGDAENDFECIELAGFSGCPTDAVPYVRDKAMYPSDYYGGKGAVHDFCMYIIAQREKEKEDKEKKDENS